MRNVENQKQQSVASQKPLKKLAGLIVALTTPFTDRNTLDRKMLVRHLRFLDEHKVRTLLVNGTTGEFFSMTRRERRRLHTIAREHFAGTMIYHASSHSLADTVAEAQWGEKNGADAVAALSPYYLSGLQSDGLINYFNAISGSISIPFIIYNHAKHTQNPVTKKVLEKVRYFGLKDSTKNYTLISSAKCYYVGTDSDMVRPNSRGGIGFVSACANFEPELFVKIARALNRKDYAAAKRLQKDAAALSARCSGPKKIALVKKEISRKLSGYPITVRLPLVELAKEE